jgi:hypothetical protein
LPLPAHNVPSAEAITVHRNGAAVSATREADGPRNIRPSLSIDRSDASPLRKSAWVDTVQNVGVAAMRPIHPARTAAITRAPIAAGLRGATGRNRRRGSGRRARPLNLSMG